MAECFCGCRRKVTFRNRGFNKQGRRTVELLGKLENLHDTINAEGSWAQALERGMLDALRAQVTEAIEDGREYRRFWQNLVHHDDVPDFADAREIKREWTAWGKGGRYAVAAFAAMEKEQARRSLYVSL